MWGELLMGLGKWDRRLIWAIFWPMDVVARLIEPRAPQPPLDPTGE